MVMRDVFAAAVVVAFFILIFWDANTGHRRDPNDEDR